MSGAGIKLQPFRDALHQNDPDGEKERNGSMMMMMMMNICTSSSAHRVEFDNINLSVDIILSQIYHMPLGVL